MIEGHRMSIARDDDTGRLMTRVGAGLMIAAGVALAGCQTNGTTSSLFGGDADPITTGSTGASNESIRETTQLARTWEADPSNVDVALAYADALKRLGSDAQAVDVLRRTMMQSPDDPRLLAAYGKGLAATGQYDEASQVLYKAIAMGGAGWQLYSTQGTVLDRMGEHARAREYYEAALEARPNEPKILNNLAMSHALDGSPQEAERILREALSRNSSGAIGSTMRQNLALALGLQGKFDEARTVLAQELPPEQVEANLAFIRGMLTQPNTWQQLSTGG
jgi:Flp pilus assembly protein TadD